MIMDQDFVLLISRLDEMQARLLAGNLEASGIKAKLASTSVGAMRSSAQNLFGVYVQQEDLERSKLFILALPQASGMDRRARRLSMVSFLLIALAIVAYLISKFV